MFFPQLHPATSPTLKRTSVYYRLLPFSIEPQKEPHIGTTHWHDFVQLWYTFSGSSKIAIGGNEIMQTAGQLTVIPPYMIHRFDSSESNPATLRHVCISLFDDLFENNIAPLHTIAHDTIVFENSVLPTSFIFTGEDKERADSIFTKLLSEFARHHDMDRGLIYKNITAALSLLSERSDEVMHSAAISRESEQFKLISSATDYIAENYSRDISIETLSSHMHMSQSSFSNKFKHTTGQTFASYCKRTKIARAICLLRLSRKTLSEIADECGFYDSTHLSHTIKATFGFSPLILRAQMLEQQKTYGLTRHLNSMERLEWMDVLSPDEIAHFRRCACGMPD